MTNKELNIQIVNLRAIQNITDVYQQVAAMRMRKIKDTVIQNRKFYESLSEVYMETQRFYSKTKALAAKGARYSPMLVEKTNGKSVAVLITANTGLYGSVVKDVFDLFVKDHKDSNSDLVVVGRLGRNWIQALKLPKPFKYFDLQDGIEYIDAGIKLIFDYVSNYSDIMVYHGLFKNITNQPAKATKVTQKTAQTEAESPETPGGQTLSFIFEPTIERVLISFEEQLVYSFFDQSIYESALAKFGSRMMSLDTATQNVSKALAAARLASPKMKHRKQNKRQMDLISSIDLWK